MTIRLGELVSAQRELLSPLDVSGEPFCAAHQRFSVELDLFVLHGLILIVSRA